MCRLAAITPMDLDQGMRSLVFDALMIRSQADDNQSYGVGVCDGVNIRKSGRSALQVPLIKWIKSLDSARTWFAHLRKPSNGTLGASTFGAHPFAFPESGLIGMHNGYIAGVLPEKAETDKPFVDSFYALQNLSDRIIDQPLTSQIIEEWLSIFQAGSQYTCMVSHRGEFWIIKGIRPMFSITLNGGHVFATSQTSLASAVDFTEELWPTYFRWGKAINEIKDYSLIRIDVNGKPHYSSIKTRVPDFPDPCLEVFSVTIPWRAV